MKRVSKKGLAGNYTWTYGELIDTFDKNILVRLERVDGFYLIEDKGKKRFGLLTVGWGSCSACDAAMAVSDLNGAIELRDRLFDSIVWLGDNLDAAQEYILFEKDWEGTHFFKREVKLFKESVYAL